MKKYRVQVNGETFEVAVEELDVPSATEGGSVAVAAARPSQQHAAPLQTIAEKTKPSIVATAQPSAGGGEPVNAPLPGTVLEVMVSSGQQVSSGDVMLILEAMKMENEIVAPADGVVGEILVNKGSTVSSGDVLLIIK